jgi:glycosyltransferase involved in cell wall biosynthesis
MEVIVSIVVPIYNYGFVLRETLDNLRQQSFTQWEAILVDDGSTDTTATIAKEYVQLDGRFRYLYQENSGVSVARNQGIRLARGKYIQFLDADDLLSADKLSIQVKYMEAHPESAVTYTNHIYFENDDPSKTYPDYERNNYDWLQRVDKQGLPLIEMLLHANIAVVSSPLLLRELALKVGGFPENSHHTEDWEFWFLCTLQNVRFTFIEHPKALTRIRIHEQSVSQSIGTMQIGELRFRDRIASHLSKARLSEEQIQDLLKKNVKSRDKLFKYMMYHADLTNWSYLQALANLVGPKRFVSYLFKSLNYKRKQLFKPQRRVYNRVSYGED